MVVAFSPLITRIYSPEVFGLQGVFLSLISILGPLIALRYPMAIIVADNDDEALKIGQLAMYIAGTVACIMWGGLLIGGQTVTTLIGAEGLGYLVFFLPFALLSVAVQNVADFRAARLGAFRLVGIVSVLQALVTNLARVLGGLWSPVAAILIGVTTMAPAVKSAMLMVGSKKMRVRAPALTRSEAIALLKKHRDFPIFRAPTDLIHALSQSAPIILLSAQYSPAAAGFYLLAHTVIKLPLNIVGSALGNVVYAKIAELSRDGNALFPFVARVTVFQLAVPGGSLAVAAFFFPSIFKFAFGENWIDSGIYAQWMVLWIIGMLTNIPGVRALTVIGAHRWHLFFNSFIAVAGISTLILASQLSGSVYDAVVYFSMATAGVYALQIVTYLVIVRVNDSKSVYND